MSCRGNGSAGGETRGTADLLGVGSLVVFIIKAPEAFLLDEGQHCATQFPSGAILDMIRCRPHYRKLQVRRWSRRLKVNGSSWKEQEHHIAFQQT
jgi:hypothetical protein